MMSILGVLLLVAPGLAQGEAAAAAKPPARIQFSDAARTALAAARELANKAEDLDGPGRATAIEAAAQRYDQVATDFAAEPAAAAQAAFAAGELWCKHGSLELADRDYLAAARLDPVRYAQRATLAAADMQRRLDRHEEALATYGKAIAIAPGTARAQTARLRQGRLLLTLGRRDEAVTAFRAALESAATPRQSLDACNDLARALIDQGDFAGAQAALRHAEQAVAAAIAADPTQQATLQRALERMSSRKALQRAMDQKTNAAEDARKLEAARPGPGR
jgi:tetratricopeptide (TPR) repeat protein